ncbi:hypothetical protein TRSC58_07472 [Trypanosoma rangeli SC58]|uniref:Uncharacterized protein n=1 Tax=Trypanosoma rangeli SC58 TaxID=429131 RepID=A0A061IV82_TRYRA|nr:hypothetical protein TRSC58_07472 [Trypanosoma rangeli SC58]
MVCVCVCVTPPLAGPRLNLSYSTLLPTLQMDSLHTQKHNFKINIFFSSSSSKTKASHTTSSEEMTSSIKQEKKKTMNTTKEHRPKRTHIRQQKPKTKNQK